VGRKGEEWGRVSPTEERGANGRVGISIMLYRECMASQFYIILRV